MFVLTQADWFALAMWLQHLRFPICSSHYVSFPCTLSLSLYLYLYLSLPLFVFPHSFEYQAVFCEYIFHWWISSFSLICFQIQHDMLMGCFCRFVLCSSSYMLLHLFKVCCISFLFFCMSLLPVVLLVFRHTYLNSWVWCGVYTDALYEVMGDWVAVCMYCLDTICFNLRIVATILVKPYRNQSLF